MLKTTIVTQNNLPSDRKPKNIFQLVYEVVVMDSDFTTIPYFFGNVEAVETHG